MRLSEFQSEATIGFGYFEADLGLFLRCGGRNEETPKVAFFFFYPDLVLFFCFGSPGFGLFEYSMGIGTSL